MKLFTGKSLDELYQKVNMSTVLFEMFKHDIGVASFPDREPVALTHGKCPFCEEDTFFAMNETQGYACLSCDAHGDLISLLMDSKNWSFPEAIEYLAKRFDVDLVECCEEKEEEPLPRIQAAICGKVPFVRELEELLGKYLVDASK